MTAGDWNTGDAWENWEVKTGNLSIEVFNFCTVAQRLSMDQQIRLVERSESHVQLQQEVDAAFIAAILRHTNLPGDTNRSKPVNESSGAPNSAVAGNGALTHELLMVTYNEDTLEGKIAGLSFFGRSSHVHAIRLVRYIAFDNGPFSKSRIAIAEYKFKKFYLTNRKITTEVDSAVAEQEHVVRIMNIHLHHELAKQNGKVKSPQEMYTRFWDIVAILMVEYEARCVGGDFNMAAVRAVPELRRR